MNLDILNFGTDEAQARLNLDHTECGLLMDACAALREARFPGVLDKLPHHFDEEDVTKALGSVEQAEVLLNLFEAEQIFHQALHCFPEGHAHSHEHGHDH